MPAGARGAAERPRRPVPVRRHPAAQGAAPQQQQFAADGTPVANAALGLNVFDATHATLAGIPRVGLVDALSLLADVAPPDDLEPFVVHAAPAGTDVDRATDLVPFAAGIAAEAEAVMLAHVTYPQVAPEPAGYSPFWIDTILRKEMGFRGVVFSDDIGMAAAFSAGGIKQKAGVAAACLQDGAEPAFLRSDGVKIIIDRHARLFGGPGDLNAGFA